MKLAVALLYTIALPTALSSMDFVINTPTNVAATMLTQQIAAHRLKAHKQVCKQAQALLTIIGTEPRANNIQHQSTPSIDLNKLINNLFNKACSLTEQESSCAIHYYYFSQEIRPILSMIATDAPEGLDRIEQLLNHPPHQSSPTSAFDRYLLALLTASKKIADEPCCSLL